MSSDYIYYNGSIVSQVPPGTNIFQYGPNMRSPAIYLDQRSSAIIKNPSQYSVSVASFQCPLQNQPVRFIKQNNVDFPLSPGTINKTYYYVAMSYNGVFSDSVDGNLVWIPEDAVTPQYYYGLFTIQHFLNMINASLSNVWFNLNNKIPLPTFDIPYYIYNKEDFTISLVSNYEFYSTDGNVLLPINIFMNTQLYDIFYNLPGLYINGSDANKNNYKLLVSNLGDNLYDQTDANAVIYYELFEGSLALPPEKPFPPEKIDAIVCVMNQEYSTLWNICTLQNILITTGTLPVNTENQSPQIIDTSVTGSNTYNDPSSNFLSVLTSFQVAGPVDNTWWSSRQRIEYNNAVTTENRNIQMHGEVDINRIDIKIFLQYSDGSFFQLYLNSESTISFKLVFNRMDTELSKRHNMYDPQSITNIKDPIIKFPVEDKTKIKEQGKGAINYMNLKNY